MPRLTIIRGDLERTVAFDGQKNLSEILTEQGFYVPHPCGGRGTCKKCLVNVNGEKVLSCRYTLTGDATVILPQTENIVSAVGAAETNRLTDKVCLCLDVGTTTLALALVSLDEKAVIRTVTAPNPQRAFGADVISRIDYCMKNGVGEIRRVLLEKAGEMASDLLASFGLSHVEKLFAAGNSTMLHILCGVDPSPMGVSPYTPVFLEEQALSGDKFSLEGVEKVITIPGISAFVGADIVAGIDSVGLPEEGKYRLLIDLGTNAEIALFSREKILCTAAAAGPCFEGANISCGMSATEGAVCAFDFGGGVSVIGGGVAKGLCATGLIDVIAECVRRDIIEESGFMEDEVFKVCEGVELTDRDVREFQLAKSAIRAATECLMSREGVAPEDIDALYVAGGFSADLNVKNAAYIGLIPDALAEKFHGINNASLGGAVKYALNGKTGAPLSGAEYIDLSADPDFAELFMEYMYF